MGNRQRKTPIRLSPEEKAELEAKNEVKQKKKPVNPEVLAFRTGNRRTRRKIAKRNGFFKDKSGLAWRRSNEMIRTGEEDVNL